MDQAKVLTFDELAKKKSLKEKTINFEASSECSPEKQNQVIEWCKKMQRKNPHMKPERIARKAAEYFHIKVV